MYSSLFPLGVGRGLRTRETALSVLALYTLIPVFSSEPVVLWESPSPLLRWRFHGRFHGRCLEVREESLALQSLPALFTTPEDLAELSRRTAVAPATAVSATSARPTSSQTCPWAARSVCLPGRNLRVGSRGLNRIGHRFPFFDGSRPAGPGALFMVQKMSPLKLFVLLL